MKHLFVILCLMIITGSSISKCNQELKNYFFYTKIGSGVSCSKSANVIASYPPWNPAIQGYDAKLGNCPIASFSVGCELGHAVDLEFNIANRSIFKYRKFQTPTAGGDSYTREFDLNVTSILFSANFLGLGISRLNWDIARGTLYPIAGVGLGSSDLLITNYRTTGLPPTGDSTPYPSFSSENQYCLRRNFTYTLLAGLEYNYNDSWGIGTGYRWFNAGKFNGPRYQRVASGSAVDVGGYEWDMRFQANEWFIELKIFI